jgi:D-sedoheptulose 7-phosphate isomerase
MEPSDAAVSLITDRLRQSAEVTEAMSARASDIARAAAIITDSFRRGGKLLLCGNGGSAADCQHIAAEFVNRLSKDRERRALPALALTTDTSCLTAYGNDYGFEGVYARQVEAFGTAGDVLLAISTSGSSPNVLAAADVARARGMTVVAMLGETGRIGGAEYVAINGPSRDTLLIHQVHLAVEHLICELVEQALFR